MINFVVFCIFAIAILYEAKILAKPDRLAWIYRISKRKSSGEDVLSSIQVGIFNLFYMFATLYGLYHYPFPIKNTNDYFINIFYISRNNS